MDIDNKINGRTPEEVKKGLEYCISESVLSCDECPYVGKPCDGMQMLKDALAYIQKLEAGIEHCYVIAKDVSKHIKNSREHAGRMDVLIQRLKHDT